MRSAAIAIRFPGTEARQREIRAPLDAALE